MSTLNFILGFHTYLEDYKEVKRIVGEFGIDSIVLSDPSEMLDSGLTGEYKLYYGGTPIKDIYRAKFSSATVCFQKYSTEKTREYIEKVWKQPTYVVRPYGIQGTDEFVQLLSKLSGKPVPDTLVNLPPFGSIPTFPYIKKGRARPALRPAYLTVSLRSFAGLKTTTFLAGIFISAPVLGLRPFLAALVLTANIPKPGTATLSPFLRALETAWMAALRAASACFLVIPAPLAMAETSSALVMAFPP